MPIPITSLDDRKFADLVAEARLRLRQHIPEMQPLVEGDPVHALIDVLAWMTESVIYRANLIPERQRQAFLNLLQIPLRPAIPARGLVSVDPRANTVQLPPLLKKESALSAGDVQFHSESELQPMPLALAAMIKEKISPLELSEMGIAQQSLQDIYGVKASAFRPRTFNLGSDTLDLASSFDNKFYLLAYLPSRRLASGIDTLRSSLAGKIINIGLAPVDEVPAEKAQDLAPRQLKWHIAWQQGVDDKNAVYLPLEVVQDSSNGGRKMGVARLRLPKSTAVLSSKFTTDPQFAGFGNTPPEPPGDVAADQVVFWLTLSAPGESDFQLAYLAINSIEVVGQGIVRDQVIGVGDGRPGQVFSLDRSDVDAASLQLDISEQGVYVLWQQVNHFAASDANDRVYKLDAASGVVSFGDGLRGRRPPTGSRVRAVAYRFGGGTQGNFPADTIKQITSSSSMHLQVRHEWPTRYGQNAETVAQAEQRIPAFLSHRNRAVTREDFGQLARDNPVAPVARAEVVAGLLPGSSLDSVRLKVPGVVSLFVLPPAEPAIAAAPRPSAGLLRDVYGYMDARKLLGTELYVLSPEFIPIAISVSISVLDPSVTTETLNAVNNALLDYLWALSPGGPAGSGWPLGRAIDRNELTTVAARVDGVLAVGQLRLFYQLRSGDWAEEQKLVLAPYQLPEVMTVEAQQGEAIPDTPAVVDTAPSSGPENDSVPVPVIPETC